MSSARSATPTAKPAACSTMPSTRNRSIKTSTPCSTPSMKRPTADAERGRRSRSEAGREQPVGRTAWRIVQYLLVAYLIVVLAMTLLETWLVYPAPPPNDGDWHPAGLNQEEVSFTSADGTKLHGWFVAASASQARDPLLPRQRRAHRATTPTSSPTSATQLRRLGLHLRLPRLRPQRRPPDRSRLHRRRPRRPALARRPNRRADRAKSSSWAVRWAAAVAVAVAAEQGAKALVLENTFSRMTDVAAYHYPWLPVRLVMRNRYDSLARIRNYHGPCSKATARPTRSCRSNSPANYSPRPQRPKTVPRVPRHRPQRSVRHELLPRLASFLDRFARELPPNGTSTAE